MASFNFGIDCSSDDAASALRDFIEQLEIYQAELDYEDERVSVVSKQTLLGELGKYAKDNGASFEVEVWPEDVDYDDADEAGDIEFHSFPE
ncbi:MAG: hypothetical protein VW270_09775 [Candidatus Poseidoniales archaeon]